MAELTKQRKDCIRSSWDVIRAKPVDNGVDLFLGLLTTYPAYKDLFVDFRNISLEELSRGTNAKLRAHGTRLVHSLSSIIDSLDELDVAVEIMKKLVDDHYPKGVRYHQYENLFGLVPGFIEGKLGAEYDEVMAGAWAAAATVLLSVIKEEIDHLAEA